MRLARQRRLEELRARWGQVGTKDGWLASRYFELTRTEAPSRHVDDRTWNDLEFPRIFQTLDTTVTRLGSQCLFRQLRTYPEDPCSAAADYETAQALGRDQRLRERIQLSLAGLEADSCASIADSLFGEPLENLKYRRAIVLWSLTCIAVLVGVLALSWTPLLVLPVLAFNAAMHLWLSPRAFRLVEALNGCQALVGVARGLARTGPAERIPQLRGLAAARRTFVRAQRAFRWLRVLERLHEPLGLDAWLSFLCLGDLVAYIRTIGGLAELRSDLRELFELVGSLDAAIAVASFLERAGPHCAPLVGSEACIEIVAGRHPLLARQTPNSIALRSRSALISGSNMAGKTTLIKMVATNIILGRTLGVCLATSAIIPLAGVMASIRGEHSIESGKSRYFVEMEALLAFLRCAAAGEPRVFVIDEPFSGTNTGERIGAAKAVLLALSRHAQVLATTHDVELKDLLKERFDMFHFTEDPDVEGFFDFRLRPGPCTEGNALRLLAKIGFPREVVDEALATARGRR